MGRPTRSQTRTLILQAAAREFAKNGIDASSLETVAASAGLTKGAIFSNFSSKDDLVLAVADEYRADIDYSMFLDSNRPFADQLREFGRAVHDTLHGATRRQVRLDRAMQAYLLRHAGARRRHREQLTSVAEAGGAWLEALAEQRGTALPLPGPRFVQLLNALARGLMESALHDPTLLDETYFADSFALLDPDIHLRS